jgi:hypothetical protein
VLDTTYFFAASIADYLYGKFFQSARAACAEEKGAGSVSKIFGPLSVSGKLARRLRAFLISLA